MKNKRTGIKLMSIGLVLISLASMFTGCGPKLVLKLPTETSEEKEIVGEEDLLENDTSKKDDSEKKETKDKSNSTEDIASSDQKGNDTGSQQTEEKKNTELQQETKSNNENAGGDAFVDEGGSATMVNDSGSYDIVGYEPNKTSSSGEVQLYMTRGCSVAAESRAQSIAAMASGSEFDKVRYIHDYLINHAYYYDNNSEEVHSADGVLLSGYGVCESYTNAFSLICYYAGINAELVTGSADDVLHCWNLVQIDGNWYHVDVTWDDPVLPDGSQVCRYNYFLVTDAKIQENHVISTCSNQHVCNDNQYANFSEQEEIASCNAYLATAVEGLTRFDISNTSEIEAVVMKCVEEGPSHFAVVLSTGVVIGDENQAKKYVDEMYSYLEGKVNASMNYYWYQGANTVVVEITLL